LLLRTFGSSWFFKYMAARIWPSRGTSATSSYSIIRSEAHLDEELVDSLMSIVERALCLLSLGLVGRFKGLELAEEPLGFHFAVILMPSA